MHKLLQHQIAEASLDGKLDLERLLALVDARYTTVDAPQLFDLELKILELPKVTAMPAPQQAAMLLPAMLPFPAAAVPDENIDFNVFDLPTLQLPSESTLPESVIAAAKASIISPAPSAYLRAPPSPSEQLASIPTIALPEDELQAVQRRALISEPTQQDLADFTALLDAVNESILMVDSAGHVITANLAAEVLFCAPRMGLGSLPLRVLFESAENLLSLPVGKRVECVAITRYGTTAAVELMANDIISKGERIAIYSLHDMRERKQAEAANTVQAQLTARANAEMERFAFAASHDLQEPLRTLGSFTRLLQRRYADKFDEEGREFMDFIAEAGGRMSTMVRSLLDLAGIQSKGPRYANANLQVLLDEAIEELQKPIAETQAVIAIMDPLPVLKVDASQIRRVLVILLSNAVKFKNLGVSPRIELFAKQHAKFWRFGVRDNGLGVPAEHRKKIFDLFARLYPREEYPGSGIGLALAQKTIFIHGGEIGVMDTPSGEGSEFWFTLPVEPPALTTQTLLLPQTLE